MIESKLFKKEEGGLLEDFYHKLIKIADFR